MRSKIRQADAHWTGAQLDASSETVAASDRSFPSVAQASAAALAFAHPVRGRATR